MNNKGFSVIEVLVSIAIIGLIVGLSFGFYKYNNIKNFINDDAYLLKTNILYIRNMAKSGQSATKYSDDIGYGIYFNITNRNRYLLYEDKNHNNHYDINESISAVSINYSRLYSLSSGNSMDLLFKSNGEIYLNNNKTILQNIVISLNNNNETKNITFNAQTGVIKIQ